jgi:hypothetical protein
MHIVHFITIKSFMILALDPRQDGVSDVVQRVNEQKGPPLL